MAQYNTLPRSLCPVLIYVPISSGRVSLQEEPWSNTTSHKKHFIIRFDITTIKSWKHIKYNMQNQYSIDSFLLLVFHRDVRILNYSWDLFHPGWWDQVATIVSPQRILVGTMQINVLLFFELHIYWCSVYYISLIVLSLPNKIAFLACAFRFFSL